MSALIVDILSTGAVDVGFAGSAAWNDKDPLSMIFIANGAQNESEAFRQVEDALKRNGLDWFEYTGAEWVLKADVLRGQLAQAHRFPWLTGMITVKPVFSEQPMLMSGTPKGPTVRVEVDEPGS
jgi:hypothetical protein